MYLALFRVKKHIEVIFIFEKLNFKNLFNFYYVFHKYLNVTFFFKKLLNMEKLFELLQFLYKMPFVSAS